MNAQEPPKIKLSVGANTFVATLYNNTTANAYAAVLPMLITMNELNGNEKYFFLSGNLPSAPENPTIIHTGDLMLYSTNCIVLFYETFNTSYHYTKIGVVDDTAGLKEALGVGNPTVIFELLNHTGIKSSDFINTGFKITEDEIVVDENIKAVSLMDMTGRTIRITTSKTININELPKGIYLLLIENPQKTKAFKVII